MHIKGKSEKSHIFGFAVDDSPIGRTKVSVSEPALGVIGGIWEEPFVLPLDPEFVFQRTGFACMNEGQFPPNSVDPEEADLFYDHGCKVEKNLSNTGCHQTKMPTLSCNQALAQHIGRVTTAVRFTRLPWSSSVADTVRQGAITDVSGPDLLPDQKRFQNQRLTYRYIPSNSCTLEENCVGGSGWRKLLMFPTADVNRGIAPLDIGLVDYFHTKGGTALSEHGMFELSQCHGHYHFMHYGLFTLDGNNDGIARKNGFCMQPTERIDNHELSPIQHRYIDCIDQGVATGWIDEYRMGLECQWMDVTDVPVGQKRTLTFTTNPDALLCEGTLVQNENNEQMYESTLLRTSTNEIIQKPVCIQSETALLNNSETAEVTLPQDGESYITEACKTEQIGMLRNCGLQNNKELLSCTPGASTIVECTFKTEGSPHIIRLCEGSRALQTGIPCTYSDALVNDVLLGKSQLTFTCPTGRDQVETGGVFYYMAGPLFVGDSQVTVECRIIE